MQYITDTHKNITHVLVPIEEWNVLQAKIGDHKPLNPYQPIIDYMKAKVGETSVEYRLIFSNQLPLDTGTIEPDHINMPICRLLIDILEGDEYIEEIVEDIKNTTFLPGLELSMTSFLLPIRKVDAKIIAVSYILRNEEFYQALCNSKDMVSPSEKSIFNRYGFNIEEFKSEMDPTLLTVLYTQHKNEFIRESLLVIAKYFSLTPIKERIRREPELMRLFFFDIFETLDELLSKEPSFGEIFGTYPLVDTLAKEFYPGNTLSGATSRVYKAKKEARVIVNTDWQKYVSVN